MRSMVERSPTKSTRLSTSKPLTPPRYSFLALPRDRTRFLTIVPDPVAGAGRDEEAAQGDGRGSRCPVRDTGKGREGDERHPRSLSSPLLNPRVLLVACPFGAPLTSAISFAALLIVVLA